MQCATAHVSDLWHIVCGTVLFMFLITSHFVQRYFVLQKTRNPVLYILVMLEQRKEVEVHVKVFNGNCIYLCME